MARSLHRIMRDCVTRAAAQLGAEASDLQESQCREARVLQQRISDLVPPQGCQGSGAGPNPSPRFRMRALAAVDSCRRNGVPAQGSVSPRARRGGGGAEGWGKGAAAWTAHHEEEPRREHRELVAVTCHKGISAGNAAAEDAAASANPEAASFSNAIASRANATGPLLTPSPPSGAAKRFMRRHSTALQTHSSVGLPWASAAPAPEARSSEGGCPDAAAILVLKAALVDEVPPVADSNSTAGRSLSARGVRQPLAFTQSSSEATGGSLVLPAGFQGDQRGDTLFTATRPTGSSRSPTSQSASSSSGGQGPGGGQPRSSREASVAAQASAGGSSGSNGSVSLPAMLREVPSAPPPAEEEEEDQGVLSPGGSGAQWVSAVASPLRRRWVDALPGGHGAASMIACPGPR